VFRVKLSVLAQEDLISVWEYYSGASNIETADQLLHRLNTKINSLADFPDRGVLREDLKIGVRMSVEGKFLIFYEPYKATVLILRVIHGARDLNELDIF
jgi:toxin ParE1/3/4